MLDPYPSPEQRERELVELSSRVAGSELVRYGASVEGRALEALRIPSRRPDAPRVLVCANIHGPEYVGNRVCMAIGDAPGLELLRESAEVWLAPCLNPDGYARTWERDGVGPLPRLRHNARGVDLNRNWPLPTGERRHALPGAGSPTPGHATFRGESPLSEPETRALDELLRAQDFHASANLHSFMGVLFPARVRDREAFSSYRELCRSFAAAQPSVHYRRIASRRFDTFTGEQEDHQHHTRRCWAVCIECFALGSSFAQHLRAPNLFWRFNPHDPTPWITNDVPGVIAYLLAAIQRPRPGSA